MIRSAGRPGEGAQPLCLYGGATLACLEAGAEVVHVDASKAWLPGRRRMRQPPGWQAGLCAGLLTTALSSSSGKFACGHRYDIIIMDPPSYGRGRRGRSGSWRIRYTPLWSCARRPLRGCADGACQFLYDRPFPGRDAVYLGLRWSIRALAERFRPMKSALPASASQMALPCGATAIWRGPACRE